MPPSDQPPYDLFISYAHRDNTGNAGDDRRPIAAIKAAIEREFEAMTGRPPRIFLDDVAIVTGDNWRNIILAALKQAKLMLAVVSENYFRSEYCRLEWQHYVDTELDQALPGDGITPIYVVSYPAFDNLTLDERLRRWARDLQRRQVDVHWQQWWPHGQTALERDDVRERLRQISATLRDRLKLADTREHAPSNPAPQLTRHFKGRRRELYELRAKLVKGHLGAITAVNGVAGIGKTELALAYAWAYGGHYPAGRFYLRVAGRFADAAEAIARLQQEIAGLAEWLGLAVSDAERQSPGVVFKKVAQHFMVQPDRPVLFVLDNVDDRILFDPGVLRAGLPQGAHIDVLITTRLPERHQDRCEWVAVDALDPEDGVELLASFVPIPESAYDQQWKAAYHIAERLGGHALALNIVGVYLRWQNETYERFLQQLAARGLQIVTGIGRELSAEQISLDSEYRDKVLAELLAPTLDHLAATQPAAYRALEFAAVCPPDHVPGPWLIALLVADEPSWGTDQLGGSVAARAVQTLREYRLLSPLRHDQAGLASETHEDRHLSRIHRVYQELILGRLSAAEQAELRRRLYMHVSERAEYLRDHWGASDAVWEVWPLVDVAEERREDVDNDVALLCERVAAVLRHVGRGGDVERLRRRAVAILEQLCEREPTNDFYARNLSVFYNQLGDLFSALGDGRGAREFYEKSLSVSERLAAAAPEKADYARDLSVSYNKLGDVFRALGDGRGAREFYEKDLAIAERLAAAAPENADYARDLSISYNKLGDVFSALGDVRGAREFYEKDLAIAERLAAAAPENADWQRDLYISYWRMGRLAEISGDTVEERRWWQAAHDVLQRMVDRGWFVSPEDLGFLEQLKQKLGLI